SDRRGAVRIAVGPRIVNPAFGKARPKAGIAARNSKRSTRSGVDDIPNTSSNGTTGAGIGGQGQIRHSDPVIANGALGRVPKRPILFQGDEQDVTTARRRPESKIGRDASGRASGRGCKIPVINRE